MKSIKLCLPFTFELAGIFLTSSEYFFSFCSIFLSIIFSVILFFSFNFFCTFFNEFSISSLSFFKFLTISLSVWVPRFFFFGPLYSFWVAMSRELGALNRANYERASNNNKRRSAEAPVNEAERQKQKAELTRLFFFKIEFWRANDLIKTILNFSVYKSLQKAKLDGWINITREIIKEKRTNPGPTMLQPPRLRSQLDAKTIFFSIFTNNLLDHFVDAANSNAQITLDGKSGPKPQFIRRDIVGYIQLIIKTSASGLKKWKPLVRDPTRSWGIARKKMESLSKYFGFSPETVSRMFNKGLQKFFVV